MCECKINILFTRGFILTGTILVGNKYTRYTWNAFIHRQTKVYFLIKVFPIAFEIQWNLYNSILIWKKI